MGKAGCFLVAALAAAPACAAPIGSAITYQGRLDVAGEPATGLFDLQLCLYSGLLDGPAVVCAQDLPDVPVEAGIFTVDADFGAAAFGSEARYLELRIRPGDAAATDAYAVLTPRQALRPAPWALFSTTAPWSGLAGVPPGFADGVDNTGGTVNSISAGFGLSGGTVTSSGTFSVDPLVMQRRVTGTCPAGSGILAINPDGSVGCGSGAGTVTSVTAGSGLLGGVITGSGTLAVDTATIQRRVAGTCVAGAAVTAVNVDGTVQCNPAGSGTVTAITGGAGLVGGTITSTGTLAVNPVAVQSRVSGSCSVGSTIRAINQDGTVTCAAAVTSVAAGFGLAGGTITGTGSLAIDPSVTQRRVSGTCATGQAMASINQDGTVQCGAAGTVTSVAAGTGLAGGPITTSGTLAIANGGVGLAQIDTAQVQARIVGTCPDGTFLQSVLATGQVTCAPPPGSEGATLLASDANQTLSNFVIRVGSDGLPAIAFANFNALKLVKCTDAACTGPATVRTLFTSQVKVDHVALAMRPGALPSVAFQDGNGSDLKVASCSTPDCAGALVVTIDATGSAGVSASIAVGGDGKPAIAYVEASAGVVKLAKCSAADCSTSSLAVVDAASPLADVSLDVSQDAASLPIMSYIDTGAGALRFAVCSTATCSTTITRAVVEDVAAVLAGPTSIAYGRFSNPYPIIAYRDATAAAIKIARCKSAACSAAKITVLDDPADGSIGSLGDVVIADDGLPIVSYTDSTVGVVKIAKCRDAACSTGASIAGLDNTAAFGNFSSLAMRADRLPIVAYGVSYLPSLLKVYHCANRSCQ